MWGSSLTRSRVCSFQFFLGIVSAAFLRYESHYLLSLFLRLPQSGSPTPIPKWPVPAIHHLQAVTSGADKFLIANWLESNTVPRPCTECRHSYWLSQTKATWSYAMLFTSGNPYSQNRLHPFWPDFTVAEIAIRSDFMPQPPWHIRLLQVQLVSLRNRGKLLSMPTILGNKKASPLI
jgi:hypothetical protein